MSKKNFSEKELDEARQNGFILVGKTGSGKTTLLNTINGYEVAEAKKTSFSVTKYTQIYYYKLKNGKCVSIVDTPGLSDPDIDMDNNSDLDNIHLKDIKQKISEEKIHIKGILFLVNFQEERFDSSEQEALISYNAIFPLRKFWQHLIVVFTHHYADPDGDTQEEMKQSRDESNSIIFTKLMQRVKNVSDTINYKDLIIKYYNSYSPVKNERQKLQNEKNREDIENLMNDFIKKEPLFCQIETIKAKNERIIENGKSYLVDYERIQYYDLNNLPIKEQIYFTKKEPIEEEEISYENRNSSNKNRIYSSKKK